jgi:dethiobiotin synthetase
MWCKPGHGLFVTGTDTGVGKTYVAALIARWLVQAGRRVGVYKPAASGCRREAGTLIAEDAMCLWEAAGRPGTLADVCPQRFEAPLAPHLAARSEKAELDVVHLRSGLEQWQGRCDVVVVEGAGGLLSPLGDQQCVADLAVDFGYPLVIVAPNRLGVINQALQALVTAAVYRGGMDVANLVLSDVHPNVDDLSQGSNLGQLARFCSPDVLSHVAWRAETCTPHVDWWERAARGGHPAGQIVRLPIPGASNPGI